jgi:hypothetical protein
VGYRLAFGVEMMLFQALTLGLLVAWVLRREGERAAIGRLIWSTAMLAALGPLPVARFDLAPAFFAFAAVYFWVSRPDAAGLMVGLGALAKVFPGVVLVPLTVQAPKAAWQPLRVAVGTIVLGALVWLWIGHVQDTIDYHKERGLEVGSLPAGALMVAGKALGWRLDCAMDHMSEHFFAPGADTIARYMPWAQLALLGLVAWRARGRDPMRMAGASVLSFVVAAKVLSPQYLLWILPFALAVPGRLGRWSRVLTLAACVLTTFVYPWAFIGLTHVAPIAVVLLNARNLTLVALFVWLLFGPEEETS